MDQCNLVHNMVVPSFKIMKDEEEVEVESTLYKQMVGSHMYLIATCPNLMFIVNLINRYMEHPIKSYLLAIKKKAPKYVKGTISFEIFYMNRGSEELIGYTDNDYVGDQDDIKSTSGYVFLMSLGAISWSLQK